MNPTQLLLRSLLDIFERFGFMFGEMPDESPVPPPSDVPYLNASITFIGELGAGSIVLAAPVSLCDELAANVLGLDVSDVVPAMRDDAIKEILNVTCGEFLESSYGKSPVFDLTVPQMKQTTSEELAAQADSGLLTAFTMEDNTLFACVTVDR